MSESEQTAAREVAISNPQGLHARPVMRFVDLASKFQASTTVRNVTKNGDPVDGKSAMQMMLLEATQGCLLRIETRGVDAVAAADALAALVRSAFDADSNQDAAQGEQDN